MLSLNMFFQIAFLREGSGACLADKGLRVDVSTEVVTDVAALLEYFVAAIEKTSEVRSIFLRFPAE